MLRSFRVSYTDGRRRRAAAQVLAFDADSAVHALKYVRPDAADVECEDEQGEGAAPTGENRAGPAA